MYINVIFAVFWLSLGISFFIFRWEYANGVSAGWLALLLALYNVLRCVSVYYRRVGNNEPSRHITRDKSADPPGEYYPMLDFTKLPEDPPIPDVHHDKG